MASDRPPPLADLLLVVSIHQNEMTETRLCIRDCCFRQDVLRLLPNQGCSASLRALPTHPPTHGDLCERVVLFVSRTWSRVGSRALHVLVCSPAVMLRCRACVHVTPVGETDR